MYFFLSFFTAFATGILLFPILIKILAKYNFSDIPGGRKIHTAIVPSMGGVAFSLAITIALSIWSWQFSLENSQFLFGGVCLIFLVGLRDDFVELKAFQKIVSQLVAVILVVVLSDIRIKDLYGFLGIGELNLYFSYGFSAFVLLALTNSFNLIDGLDGLAGSIATIVFSFLGFWFYIQGFESYALISFTFLGGVLAFLAFNWHPAKIFMGDTGSLTLGFTMGTLIIAFIESNGALSDSNFWRFTPVFTAGITLMIFPLYDMARVFARRIIRGQGPMTPDKSHVHHFLLRMGLKHNQVALVLVSIQIGFVFALLIMKDLSDHIALPIISVIAILLGMRLDQITVKYVKKKVGKEPKVLEKRAMQNKKKIKLESRDFDQTGINLN